MNDVIYYCFTTNFTSFVTFPVAIFLARFGKPKEWAWAWLGIGIFVSGAILCNDYPLDINSELLVLAAASEIVMSAVSIPLILKMYKIRAQKGWDKEKHRVSRVSVSDTKQLKKKGTTISEQDYQRAMRIISLSVHSKEIKELAQVMGKTPQETMNYFIGVVRNYNLERYSKKEEGR